MGAHHVVEGDRFEDVEQLTFVFVNALDVDVEKRRRMINEALMIQHDELLTLPLHRQVIPWATRSNVTAVHLANNNVIPNWVKVQ